MILQDPRDFIEKQKWTFAKSMPHIPHEYIVRQECDNEADYWNLRDYIYAHGIKRFWRGRPGWYLNYNGHKYWAMSRKDDSRIINRAVQDQIVYERIASGYDDIYSGWNYKAEDLQNYDDLNLHISGNVLDIGCGSGAMLSELNVRTNMMASYTGIDPSDDMLREADAKHHSRKDVDFCLPDLKDHWLYGTRNHAEYHVIASMYGSMSYVFPHDVPIVFNLGKPTTYYHLMFYSDDYEPDIYTKTGVEPTHFYRGGYKYLERFGLTISKVGNYTLASGFAGGKK